MKKIIILKFYILITSISFAQEKIWTLEECVDHALDNNITILQAENSLLSSEQDIISAKGNFLPLVSSNISGGASLGNIEVFPGEFRDREFYSTSIGIGFSQSIFNGFRNINLLNQSKLRQKGCKSKAKYTGNLNYLQFFIKAGISPTSLPRWRFLFWRFRRAGI